MRDRVATDPAAAAASAAALSRCRRSSTTRRRDRSAARRPWPSPHGSRRYHLDGRRRRIGLVVSYIQSLYWEFGSGCVLPATGVLMQNRGTSFSLAPGARTRLRPGRPRTRSIRRWRCCVTGASSPMAPWAAMRSRRSRQLLFTRHVAYGQHLDEALDAPRWLLGQTWGSPHASLLAEAGVDDELVDRLMSAGSRRRRCWRRRTSHSMGHAGAVVLHPDRTLEGAHDPRADGGAAGSVVPP